LALRFLSLDSPNDGAYLGSEAGFAFFHAKFPLEVFVFPMHREGELFASIKQADSC
jgi:hypothetical protein